MRLVAAEIINFRSIKKMWIDFAPRCRILVGINESGKSNIIKALSFMDPDKDFENSDIREPFDPEERIDSACIDFIFEFDKEDIKILAKNLIGLISTIDENMPLISTAAGDVNAVDLFKNHNRGIYRADLLKKTHFTLNYKIPKDYHFSPAIYSVKKAAENNLSIADKKGETKTLAEGDLVYRNSVKGEPQEWFGSVSKETTDRTIYGVISAYISENIPSVFVWNYNDDLILPEKIDQDVFIDDPNSCLPLKFMFILAGKADISQEILLAKERRATGFDNLLEQVARATTRHFKDVWKEYPDIGFSLRENGSFIDASIQDTHNRFPLKDRSDGFKQFVSFLLYISSRVKRESIENDLLIIDEPGMNLHPSGCRYLRDELIKISETNYVVFSTHSIFMIDSKRLNRHLIVSKDHEQTSVETVDESNIVDEEVIFNALGHSIYEQLKQINLVVEGWRDYALFNKALSNVPSTYAFVKKIKEYGLCYVQGVKTFNHFAPILQLMGRTCVLFSDADIMAKEYRKIHEKYNGYGTWIDFDDLDIGSGFVTAEDFLEFTAVIRAADSARETHTWLPIIEEHDLKCADGVIKLLTKKLQMAGPPNKSAVANAINAIKTSIYGDLKKTEIRAEYYEMLTKLISKIEEVSKQKQD